MSKKNELVIFANHLPYSNGEPYLVDELELLKKEFKHIHIITYYHTSDLVIDINKSDNITFHTGFNINNYDDFKPGEVLKRNFSKISKIYLFELMHSHRRGYYLSNLKKYLNYLIQVFYQVEKLNAYLEEKGIKEDLVYYTYWFDQWTNILSFYKDAYSNNNRLVTRAHAFDLNESERKGVHEFRHYSLKNIDNVVSVSSFGTEYFKKLYKKHAGKVFTSYLGKNYIDYKPCPIADEFLIISCSVSILRKRIHLILEILKHSTLNIRFVHFGDGTAQDDLKLLASTLPDNIKIEFRGYVANKEVLEFYKNNHIDMLVNTSESEGLPYSMIEAIAFGIPVMGTKVMGVPEIVNENTGILLEMDFNAQEIAQKLEIFLKEKSKNKEFRQNIRKFWELTFVAEKNYETFIKAYLK